jgi:hypothetical protein
VLIGDDQRSFFCIARQVVCVFESQLFWSFVRFVVPIRAVLRTTDVSFFRAARRFLAERPSSPRPNLVSQLTWCRNSELNDHHQPTQPFFICRKFDSSYGRQSRTADQNKYIAQSDSCVFVRFMVPTLHLACGAPALGFLIAAILNPKKLWQFSQRQLSKKGSQLKSARLSWF